MSNSSIYPKLLLALFILTLPFVNPWIRGDGVGYYAFARAPLIEHRLDFTNDWRFANTSFRMGRVDPDGRILPNEYTRTGHLDNHFAIGPAILWSPFLLAAHGGVLLWDALGGHVAANGFSAPYRFAMAFATALYGFLALWISFVIARRYLPERWAFWATLGIWFGSSLPVYMYFNPSWSHALSAFTVALFLWQWLRTRDGRTISQWLVLGALAGLMMDVYYIAAVLLVVPLVEFFFDVRRLLRLHQGSEIGRRLAGNLLLGITAAVVFFPTLYVKKVLYGSYLNFGYGVPWYWNSPAFFRVCFSAEHGLFSWTPIVILAVVGLLILRKYDGKLSTELLIAFLVFVYVMGCYSDWAGVSSYGNRFFVSFTPIFVLGLAAFVARFALLLDTRPAIARLTTAFVASLISLFIVWNAGLIFQWGAHLIPARGPISFRVAAYNQFAVVPRQAFREGERYLLHRGAMMNQIEKEDVRTLKSSEPPQGDTP